MLLLSCPRLADYFDSFSERDKQLSLINYQHVSTDRDDACKRSRSPGTPWSVPPHSSALSVESVPEDAGETAGLPKFELQTFQSRICVIVGIAERATGRMA